MWGDGIKHFTRNGHALACEITEQFPTHSQTLVDLEGLVNVRVVDQAFPADSRTWFLEVSTHDDEKIGFEFRGESDKAGAVFNGCLWIVERTWPTDDEETVIGLFDDVDSFFAALQYRWDGFLRCWKLFIEDLRRDERILRRSIHIYSNVCVES